MRAAPTLWRAPWHPPSHRPAPPEPATLAAADKHDGGEPVQRLNQLLALHLDSLHCLMARLEQQGQVASDGVAGGRAGHNLNHRYHAALTRLAALLTQADPTRQDQTQADTSPRDAAFLARVHAEAEAQLGNCLFGVNELAAAMRMTRRHLARLFAELIGHPPSHWLRNLRLTRAANLLGQGTLNISQVADQVGFAKPSHFAHQFKRKYGCTPSAYRSNSIQPSP